MEIYEITHDELWVYVCLCVFYKVFCFEQNQLLILEIIFTSLNELLRCQEVAEALFCLVLF